MNQKRFRDYTSRSSEFFGLNLGFGIFPDEIIKNPTQKWRYSISIGVLLGYKVFLFTNHFGLRLYGDANLTFGNFAPLRVDYGLNFEMLVNFIAKYNIDFGGFVGVRVGGLSAFSPNLTELNPAISAGFRVNIAKHYGVEIVLRTAIKDSQLLQMRKFSHFSGNLRILYNFDK